MFSHEKSTRRNSPERQTIYKIPRISGYIWTGIVMSSEIDEKVGVHLYLEKELLQKAREKCLNLSAFLRKKLREELGEDYQAF
ncbi:hypothetical protein CEE45_01460 [Candidatus Heimdallarchaeota archaeon B3_Heim]|nr:MAG: hypothetical protein CEE45_01460 [Candidatus Heimdallarchaeota archaeon B3_Heim]